MEESYELKVRAMLGDEFGDDKEITILNRRISWKEGCLHYEADAKRVDEILKYFNLNDESKILVVPFVRETKEELAREDAELPPDHFGSKFGRFGQKRKKVNFLTRRRHISAAYLTS